MAYKRYFVIYNGKMNTEVGVSVQRRPDIPAPIREYETVKVEGRDGELYEDKGTYEDITIQIEFNFKAEPDEWTRRFREIKNWLNGHMDRKLMFSDDIEYFYNVKAVKISDSERKIKRIGRFVANFTCEPYAYITEGQRKIKLGNALINRWEKTEPIYYIQGAGKAELIVNGYAIEVMVDKEIIIDTKLGLCFSDTGEIRNTAMYGDYDEIKLRVGKNNFQVSDGFQVYIKPNWRCI